MSPNISDQSFHQAGQIACRRILWQMDMDAPGADLDPFSTNRRCRIRRKRFCTLPRNLFRQFYLYWYDLLRCQKFPGQFFPKLPLPTHEGRIFDTVLPAPFPFALSTPGALLHKLQVSLLFQVLIFVSHFSAPVVRLMRLLRFLRLPALLRLLRPLISFVSFSYSLTSSAALLDGGLWGGYGFSRSD